MSTIQDAQEPHDDNFNRTTNFSSISTLEVVLPRANRLRSHGALEGVKLVSDLMEINIEHMNHYAYWGRKKTEMIIAWQGLYNYCGSNTISIHDDLSQLISTKHLLTLGLLNHANLTIQQIMAGQYSSHIPNKLRSLLEDIGLVFKSVLHEHASSNLGLEMSTIPNNSNLVDPADLSLILPRTIGVRDHSALKSIQTVPEFLAFSPLSVDKEIGWGQKKTYVVKAWQHFYLYCCSQAFDLDSKLGHILKQSQFEALSLLPSQSLLSLREIESGQYPNSIPTKNLNTIKDIQAVLQSITIQVRPQNIRSRLWAAIPVRGIRGQLRKTLIKHEIKTVGELCDVVYTDQITLLDQQKTHKFSKLHGIGQVKLSRLRNEVNQLLSIGVEAYRFGADGIPENLSMLMAVLERTLKNKELHIIQRRSNDYTLEEIGSELEFSRERIRQLESSARKRVAHYADTADLLLSDLNTILIRDLVIPIPKALIATHCSDQRLLKTILYLFYPKYEILEGLVSYLKKDDLNRLKAIIRLGLKKGYIDAETASSICDLVKSEDLTSELKATDIKLLDTLNQKCPSATWRSILTIEDFSRSAFKSQLTRKNHAFYQANGRFLDELNDFNFNLNVQGWQKVIGEEDLHIVDDDRLILRTKLSDHCRQFVNALLQESKGVKAKDVEAYGIFDKYRQNMTALSTLYECVQKESGEWVHADKLGLSTRDVFDIMQWGYELVRGESEAITFEFLFELYESSHLSYPIEGPRQLASIVNKHIDVRRRTNSEYLYCADSFDQEQLTLAIVDPELADELDIEANGGLTAEQVFPKSNKILWWRCEQGHTFKQSPVFRSQSRTCPGCQTRWNVSKIRQFVKSLSQHLDHFTPAELFVIFQQSGLLKTKGKGRHFVKAMSTGRLPTSELKKFGNGEPSIVDVLIDGEMTSLDEALEVYDDLNSDLSHEEEINHLLVEEVEPDAQGKQNLPAVKAQDTLKALDAVTTIPSDKAAVDFLIASALGKLWRHAYQSEQKAFEMAKTFEGGEYAETVRDQFLSEYQAAKDLELPPGYNFRPQGTLAQPNLMQRLVAVRVRDKRRFGNWSGTGAGKTLSAILATRVTGAKLTVICCPNAVVSNWSKEIKHIFPDSEVYTKTWKIPQKSNTHRYLVLNYEHFQQTTSEGKLKQFCDQYLVDFIVIDEIHFAKQRDPKAMSKRKRLIMGLVTNQGSKNSNLCVLGLSATPIINNLQEGRSLVELITGQCHEALNVNATIANCMKMYQALSTLGTRWKPNYDPQLNIIPIPVDCSSVVDDIIALGKKPSSLAIEQLLTRSRLDVIRQHCKAGERVLIYTLNVDQIANQLREVLVNDGHRVGFYTGFDKTGLEPFLEGHNNILIGSSAIGTGVDGLQTVCEKLIINVLPWTNAEYEQLIGRIYRQGQRAEQVNVIIPLTYTMLNGERWSWCESKMHRIDYKRSIADCAVDGHVPEGNLKSPAEAQKHLIGWLNRLADGQLNESSPTAMSVVLSDEEQATQHRLARYGDFSQMNGQWNNSHSQTLSNRLIQNQEEWSHYHDLYRKTRKSWTIIPFREMITWAKQLESTGLHIGDFGCGDAELAKEVGDIHNVYSFDHIAINDLVISGDMSHVPLKDKCLDHAVFCLSLMGSNFSDYLREANRVLKNKGFIHIWESTSRFDDPNRFTKELRQLGFQAFPAEQRGQFTYIEARKTGTVPHQSFSARFRAQEDVDQSEKLF